MKSSHVIKFLQTYSQMLAEEKWHNFQSDACLSDCLGWNAWAPFCQCGKNYCRMRFKVTKDDEVELYIESQPLKDSF
jgi:hypothetical protein